MYEINRKIQIRVDILAKYLDGLIDRKAAAETIELSERQFSRLVKSYRAHGILSLFHGNTGKTPKNKTIDEIEERIKFLFRTKYVGFNIKHFWEKLKDELQHFRPSYTTVRRILVASGSLHLRKRAPNKNRQLRSRYESEGIMIQIDGSTHQWFGNQKTCLIAGIDDATGKVLSAKFSNSETTFATMDVLVDIIKSKGRFHILYSDKAGIYDNKKREGFSNVARALRELDIHSILAHSPQAKGRIERLFKTLQDRLISEMRLRAIDNLEEANHFLKGYILTHNHQFAVHPSKEQTAYRELPKNINLDEVFCKRTVRTIGHGSVVHYQRDQYLIVSDMTFSLKRKTVEIREYRDHSIRFFLGNYELAVRKIKKLNKAA